VLIAIAAFSLAAALIVLLPGPDTLVVVRSIMRGGRRRGITTVLGIQTGLVVWITVAVLGLTAVLRASHVGYDVLRIAGAAYLVFLGVQSFRSRGGVAESADATAPAGRGGLVGTGFRGGLMTNLLNPKVGVFFVTFLPGFVPHGYPVGSTTLLFGAIFIALNLAYQVPLVLLAARVTALFGRAAVRRRVELVTGAVLIGFGIRLATEQG
jgi:threonine/homoserine/homoserine lactone efflux protein